MCIMSTCFCSIIFTGLIYFGTASAPQNAAVVCVVHGQDMTMLLIIMLNTLLCKQPLRGDKESIQDFSVWD